MTKDEEDGPLKKMGEVQPEFPIELQKSGPIENNSNFGPEDVPPFLREADEKSDSPPDPDEIIANQGHDPYLPLEYLLRMLVKGYNPKLDDGEIVTKARNIFYDISGIGFPQGRSKIDYHQALIEIGWKYNVALYENGNQADKIVFADLVRDAFGGDLRRVVGKEHFKEDSVIKNLRTKFFENPNLYLTLAAHDNDSDRMRELNALKMAAEHLKRVGIRMDITAAKPVRLSKNVRRPGDGR